MIRFYLEFNIILDEEITKNINLQKFIIDVTMSDAIYYLYSTDIITKDELKDIIEKYSKTINENIDKQSDNLYYYFIDELIRLMTLIESKIDLSQFSNHSLMWPRSVTFVVSISTLSTQSVIISF